MSVLDPAAPLHGMPIIPSPFVPVGSFVKFDSLGTKGIYYHRHTWVRGRKVRKHGRPRNAPRRWKVVEVREYVDPAMAKLLASI